MLRSRYTHWFGLLIVSLGLALAGAASLSAQDKTDTKAPPVPQASLEDSNAAIPILQLSSECVRVGKEAFAMKYVGKKLLIKGPNRGMERSSTGEQLLKLEAGRFVFATGFDAILPGQTVIIEATCRRALNKTAQKTLFPFEFSDCRLVGAVAQAAPRPVNSTPAPQPKPDGTYAVVDLWQFARENRTGYQEQFVGKKISVQAEYMVRGKDSKGMFLLFDKLRCDPAAGIDVSTLVQRKTYLVTGICKQSASGAMLHLTDATFKVMDVVAVAPPAPKPADYDKIPAAFDWRRQHQGKKQPEVFEKVGEETLRLKGRYLKATTYADAGRRTSYAIISGIHIPATGEFQGLKFGQEVVFEARCPKVASRQFILELTDARLVWKGPVPELPSPPAGVLQPDAIFQMKKNLQWFDEKLVGKTFRFQAVLHETFGRVPAGKFSSMGDYLAARLECDYIPEFGLLEPGAVVIVEGRLLKPSITERAARIVDCKLVEPRLELPHTPPDVNVPVFAKLADAEQYLEKKYQINIGPADVKGPRGIYFFNPPKISDEGWEEIARILKTFPTPLYVSINYRTEMTPQNLEALAQCTNLVHLALSIPTLSNRQLEAISKISSLEIARLDAFSETISRAGLAKLGALKNLKELHLRTNVENPDIEALTDIVSLRKLYLNGLHLNTDALHYLAELKDLETLHGDIVSRWTDRAVEAFKKFPKAFTFQDKELFIYGSKDLSDAGMKQLLAFPHLENFSYFPLNTNTVGAKGLQVIGELTKLKKLSLNFIENSKSEELKFLSQLKDLESIHMQVYGKYDDALAYLVPLPKLKSVSLWYSFTDDAMKHLGKMTALEEINVPFNKGLTNAGLTHLTGLRNLKMLAVADTQITAAGCEQLRQAIPGLSVRGAK